MVESVLWILGLYLVLKASQILFLSAPGYDRYRNPRLGKRLRAGEPYLALGVILVAGSLLLYAHWWAHRRAAREFDHAIMCFGRLRAYDHSPGLPHRFKRMEIWDGESTYQALAYDMGGRLGLANVAIRRMLDASTHSSLRRDAAMIGSPDASVTGAELTQIEHCVKGEWAAHDGLLNP